MNAVLGVARGAVGLRMTQQTRCDRGILEVAPVLAEPPHVVRDLGPVTAGAERLRVAPDARVDPQVLLGRAVLRDPVVRMRVRLAEVAGLAEVARVAGDAGIGVVDDVIAVGLDVELWMDVALDRFRGPRETRQPEGRVGDIAMARR